MKYKKYLKFILLLSLILLGTGCSSLMQKETVEPLKAIPMESTHQYMQNTMTLNGCKIKTHKVNILRGTEEVSCYDN